MTGADSTVAIRRTFFDECDDGLSDLEAGLMRMQAGGCDGEQIDAVFRAVHSIKGGAAAFGLDALVRFAHVFETTMDDIRSGRLAPSPAVLAMLLRANGVLADLVARARDGGRPDAAGLAAMVAELESAPGRPGDVGEADGDEIAFTPVALRGAPSMAASPSIRVDLDRVNRLIDLASELAIGQSRVTQAIARAGLPRSGPAGIALDELERVARDIQDSVTALRAQPIKRLFQRMPHLVREVAAATGKPARLVIEGETTEVDATVIEGLSDPLAHMIRNAIDHGLESASKRAAAGKPAEGTVTLRALHRAGRVVLEVCDDGGGIDRPRVRRIAVARGLVDPQAVLTEEETDALIFCPGFSTAEAVSDISGRGVGMDVVRRAVQALGGRIAIASSPGQGATFTLSLPSTQAATPAVDLARRSQIAPSAARCAPRRLAGEERVH